MKCLCFENLLSVGNSFTAPHITSTANQPVLSDKPFRHPKPAQEASLVRPLTDKLKSKGTEAKTGNKYKKSSD